MASSNRLPDSPKIWRYLGIAVLLYIGSYAFLSLMGDYDDSPYIARDQTIENDSPPYIAWHPKFVWLGHNGGNFLGYFYSPLILLDRALLHETRSISAPAVINDQSQEAAAESP